MCGWDDIVTNHSENLDTPSGPGGDGGNAGNGGIISVSQITLNNKNRFYFPNL
jgi:hypothetical protein